MKFVGVKSICHVLIASMLMLQFSLSQAGMIGAEQMVPAATVQADRMAVSAVLNRAEVASQLQAMGVDPALAQQRVASLTDSEVHALAGNINEMPAGAFPIASGWWWAIAAIIIGLAIYYYWKPTR